MNTPQQRELCDRASRDEAALRRKQQTAAGSVHSPVHDLPQHGEPPEQPRSPQASAALQSDYLRCLDEERHAWAGLAALPGEAGFDGVAWSRWRLAVEERDRATRLLINYALTDSAG